MTHVTRRLRAKKVPSSLANKLFAASYILLGLRYNEAMIATLFAGVHEMEDSTTYQAILAKGEAKGALKLGRKSLLAILSDRFGNVPKSVALAIRKCTALDRLEAALVKAAKVRSLGEFEL